MKAVKLQAKPRTVTGTSAVGRVRRSGWFPAVIYGVGENKNIQLNEHDFVQTMRGHTSEHLVMDLEVEGDQPRKVLLKDLQHHPVSGRVIHVDFHEISMTKKLRVEIPVALVGEPLGVSQQGGVLEHLMRNIVVECLPADIVEKVELDVGGLHIGDSLTVANIKLDEAKYRIISAKDLAVATVAAPRAEEEVAATPDAAAAAAAGPEVITEKKPEEGEAAAGEEGKKGGKEDAKKPADGKKPAADAGKKPAEAAKDDKKAKK